MPGHLSQAGDEDSYEEKRVWRNFSMRGKGDRGLSGMHALDEFRSDQLRNQSVVRTSVHSRPFQANV